MGATIKAEVYKKIHLVDDNIKVIFKTTVKTFAKSGGYIPLSQKYGDHEAYVIIMRDKSE